jgi:hypothetical protein
VVTDYINKEMAAGRYSEPFNPTTLTSLIGHYSCSPLGISEHNGKLRVIQDHSFPRNDPNKASINSMIDTSAFEYDWASFSQCYLYVANAPPGTQASVFDVEGAFRNMPIAPEDRKYVAVCHNELVHLDGACSFGSSSSPGIFDRAADAIVAIFRFLLIYYLLRWVDDFIFFRQPRILSPSGPWSYSYDESLIWSTAKELGWPWSVKKHIPFAHTFPYIGFVWDLDNKTVRIPKEKCEKFLSRLEQWTAGHMVSKRECDVIVGSLNHCTNVLPDGRNHLPSFYRLSASFSRASSTFVKHRIPADVAEDVSWWRNQLSTDPCISRIITPPSPLTSQIFVDASTSWGIGFYLDGHWLAWELLPGWKSEGRDIGWAEMVAVELAVLVLIHAQFRNCHLVLRSDNQGVVGALSGGKSRNPQQNAVLRRIVSLFREADIWLSIEWVSTDDNLADKPSRGLFPPLHNIFSPIPPLPTYLSRFLRLPQTLHTP